MTEPTFSWLYGPEYPSIERCCPECVTPMDVHFQPENGPCGYCVCRKRGEVYWA